MLLQGYWYRPVSLWPAGLLWPCAVLYGALGWLRRRLARPMRAGVPIISVGGLTMGGAGKTPCVLAVARLLRRLGYDTHFVLRGYGGTNRSVMPVHPDRSSARETGDEALLLARAGPCWVARDRRAGIRQAVAAGAQCIVLDDSHQNPQMVKDLSILVIDGTQGLGNRLVFPAGPLREPIRSALDRADLIVLVGDDCHDLCRTVLRDHPNLYRAKLCPLRGAALTDRPVYAFAGIGWPQKFAASLTQLGAQLVATKWFPDHHRYRTKELAALHQEAARHHAILVTTAKDWVRLPKQDREGLYVLEIALLVCGARRLRQQVRDAIARGV